MRPVDVGPPTDEAAPKRVRITARTLRAGLTSLLAAVLVGSLAPAAHAAARPEQPTAAPATAAGQSWPGNKPNKAGGKDYYIDATQGHDDAAGDLTRFRLAQPRQGERHDVRAGRPDPAQGR